MLNSIAIITPCTSILMGRWLVGHMDALHRHASQSRLQALLCTLTCTMKMHTVTEVTSFPAPSSMHQSRVNLPCPGPHVGAAVEVYGVAL